MTGPLCHAGQQWLPYTQAMRKPLDLTGQRYGRLVALERIGRDQHGNTLWRCQCDCGGTRIAQVGSLRYGAATSCGCANPRRTAPAPPRHPRSLLYGYTWTPEAGLVIDPVTAAHVRAIDALDRAGLTQHAIALAMNADHPRADGHAWHPTQIGRILMNRHLYRGGRQGKSQERWPVILEGAIPSAVDIEWAGMRRSRKRLLH